MDTIGINDWVCLFFVFFFLKEAKSHIQEKKKKHLDFNKTELAVCVLDDLEHSLPQRERGKRQTLMLIPQAASSQVWSPGWVANSFKSLTIIGRNFNRLHPPSHR